MIEKLLLAERRRIAMSYELREYDRKYYCNSIRISSDGLIQWDSSSEADTLVVCVPIGSVDVRLLAGTF